MAEPAPEEKSVPTNADERGVPPSASSESLAASNAVEATAEAMPAAATPRDMPPAGAVPPPLIAPVPAQGDERETAPVLPPPLPPAEVPPRADEISKGVRLCFVGIGVLQLVAAIAFAATEKDKPVAYAIGTIVGGTVLWPGLVLALFSISRRFRTQSRQAVVITWVWGIALLGHLGNLSQRAQKAPPVVTRQEVAKSSPTPSTRSAGAAQPVPKPATEEDRQLALRYDFSRGSHERLFRQIEGAKEERYAAVRDAYAAACAVRPQDAELAVERLQFISHFADAEDNTIASASADYEEALAYLKRAFPTKPVAVQYILEHTYGPEFQTEAKAWESRVANWPADAAARYWLLRAERAEETAVKERESFASRSFQLRHTAAAGIILAEARHQQKRDKEAAVTLKDPCFAQAEPWIRKQRMVLLFDVGAAAEGISAFRELRESAPEFVRDYDTATRLAAAHQLEDARKVVASIRNREAAWLLHRRFEFELTYGDKPGAVAAYRALRATGIKADPLLRRRFALWQRFPTASITLTDIGGAALLLLMVGLIVVAPALVLGPVHYWSLWREKRGRPAVGSTSPWGLRAAWLVMATALLVELVATWYYKAELLKPAGEKLALREQISQLLPVQAWVWSLVLAVMAALIWRGQAWRLLGPGQWSWGKAVGAGLTCAVAARGAILVYLFLVPSARTPLAQIAPWQLEFFRSFHGVAGPLGFILIVGMFVPVFEELAFRGVLLGAFTRHLPWIAANALQAVGFAVLHNSLALAPFFFAFGYVAGELARRSNGLLPSIVFHAGNNTLTAVALIAMNAKSGLLQ